jgi:hypothetical protein
MIRVKWYVPVEVLEASDIVLIFTVDAKPLQAHLGYGVREEPDVVPVVILLDEADHPCLTACISQPIMRFMALMKCLIIMPVMDVSV